MLHTSYPNSIKRKAIRLSALFFGVFLMASSCKKPEERELGSEVQPSDEELNVKRVDTLSIGAHTVQMGPIPSVSSSPGMVGVLKDPRTGKTHASLYTQALLPNSNIDLGKPYNLELDSVVLTLQYEGYYGDTSQPQTFEVFQLTEPLSASKNYDSRDSLTHSVNPIGSKTTVPQVTNSVTLQNGETKPPQLRIKLSNAFGNNILDQSGSSTMANNDAFTDFFNGIFVTSTTPNLQDKEGAVMLFELLSSNSSIKIHYRNTDTQDTATLDLEIAPNSIRFNRVLSDPSGSELGAQLNAPSLGKRELFIQDGGAAAAKLEFPTLPSLVKEMKVIPNKAELIIPISENDTLLGKYQPLLEINALLPDGSGGFDLTLDRKEEGPDHIGGGFDDNDLEYRLNLTRHFTKQFQRILNGKEYQSDLYLTAYNRDEEEGAMNNVARSKIAGPEPSSGQGLRLILTFTEYQ